MTTKAILLAAGRGSRLGPLTAETPKPLLQVGRKPIIVHILDGLIAAGIREFAIVTGYRGDRLRAELGNGAQSGVKLNYFEQTALNGTARALAVAREFAGGDPFLFSWGDILVAPTNYRAVLRKSRLADGAIAVNEVDDPWSGAAVYVDETWAVRRIVEKPPKGTSTTRWNNAGFGVLPSEVWAAIDRLEPSSRGEYELTTAISALVDRGLDIRAVPVEGPWFDIGTVESLEAARVAFG